LCSIRPSDSADDFHTVSSWRTAGPCQYSSYIFARRGWAYDASGDGWSHVKDRTLSTNPVTWSGGATSSEESCPEQHLGAAFPNLVNFDVQASAGHLSSGLNLRLGRLVAQSREPLGMTVGGLASVPCGQMTARVAPKRGILRVSRCPDDSLFALCEGDYLEYHDIDFALFYGNIRQNVAARYASWLQQ
jgi:hypothetical protein